MLPCLIPNTYPISRELYVAERYTPKNRCRYEGNLMIAATFADE